MSFESMNFLSTVRSWFANVRTDVGATSVS